MNRSMINYEEAMEVWYDSRCEPRIRLITRLRLRYPKLGEPFSYERVITENVSNHGLYICTKTRIPVQTRIYLEALDRSFQALAVVVHSIPTHAGLRVIVRRGDWLI